MKKPVEGGGARGGASAKPAQYKRVITPATQSKPANSPLKQKLSVASRSTSSSSLKRNLSVAGSNNSGVKAKNTGGAAASRRKKP